MTRPRRVLVISYLPPTGGGIATWAGILRANSAGEGVAFRFLDLPVRGGRAGPRRLAQFRDATRLFSSLFRLLAGGRVDIVHLNCCVSSAGICRDLAVAFLAVSAGVPVVVHYRGSLPDAERRLAPPSRIVLRLLVGLAQMNIGITRESVAWLDRRAPAAAAYLPNFIEDRLLLRASPSSTPRSARRPRAITVGRVSRDKGVWDLLRVARRLPHVDFVLVGEVLDEARGAIDAAPANVRFLGSVPRSDAIGWLLASDVFVFPSHREGFPNAVLEAMAAGLPVVGTRVGGIAEMIAEGEGGWLVAPGDVAGLAAAVGRLGADTALARRMGAFNRAACEKRYAFSVVLPGLVALYENLFPQRPSAEEIRRAASARQEA